MNIFSNPLSNRLLAALPDAEWHNLLPQLERVELSVGTVLSESGSAPSHVYFPTTAIISLQTVIDNGVSTESSVVGNEGVCGLPLFSGDESTTTRTSAVVRRAGIAFRLDANVAKTQFSANPCRLLLLRSSQTLIAQTTSCHEHHTLDQQLCRWLLLCLDRLPTREFLLSQEHIANMLGVCREKVSEIILTLQKAGLIGYMHDRVSVIYRAGLEKRVCACDGNRTAESARQLPPIQHEKEDDMAFMKIYA